VISQCLIYLSSSMRVQPTLGLFGASGDLLLSFSCNTCSVTLLVCTPAIYHPVILSEHEALRISYERGCGRPNVSETPSLLITLIVYRLLDSFPSYQRTRTTSRRENMSGTAPLQLINTLCAHNSTKRFQRHVTKYSHAFHWRKYF
jgi:hypothetical protein